MIIGYARVSTNDQNPEPQVDALEKAGAEQVFQEKFTGTSRERPELSQCLRMLRPGDVLVVWKLDRLARSLKDLVEIVQDLQDRGIGFKSLTESIDTTSSGGRLVFHIFGALAEQSVNVDMIVQNISENGLTDMTFSCPINQVVRAEEALTKAKSSNTLKYSKLLIDAEVAKL